MRFELPAYDELLPPSYQTIAVNEPTAPPAPKAGESETVDRLKQLEKLRADGILSAEEYESAKKKAERLQEIEKLRDDGVLSEEQYENAKRRANEPELRSIS